MSLALWVKITSGTAGTFVSNCGTLRCSQLSGVQTCQVFPSRAGLTGSAAACMWEVYMSGGAVFHRVRACVAAVEIVDPSHHSLLHPILTPVCCLPSRVCMCAVLLI